MGGGKFPGRQGKAACTVKETRSKVAEHVRKVFLQAKGDRGDDAGGGKHPRQNADGPAIREGFGRTEPRSATPGDGGTGAAKNPGAGRIRANAIRGIPCCVRPIETGRGQSSSGKNRNGRSQFTTRHLDRKKIHKSRTFLPRSDSGGKYGPDEGGGEV